MSNQEMLRNLMKKAHIFMLKWMYGLSGNDYRVAML